MAKIYRDLATRFINPQSNIIVIRMESSAGRSRVMIELELADVLEDYGVQVPRE